MSLINDALKRAKQAQSPAPPPSTPHLHFRPVEPGQTVRHGFGLMFPVALALVALLILFLVWELAQTNAATKQPGSSRPSELVARAASRPSTPATPAVSPALPATPTTSESAPAAPVVATTDSKVTDDAPAPAKPAPLRLQAIVFDPAHPSAMINGKTVFIGEKVGEFRVGAISRNSATLINAGQTNILELAE